MPPRTSFAGRRRFLNRALARVSRVALALPLLLAAAPAALAAAGDADTTFNPGAGITRRSSVSAIAVQPDGKLIVGGSFSGLGGAARGGVVRLNPDGSPDASFGGSGIGANGAVSAIALQPDGKILLGGSFTSYDGVARGGVLRLNADGSLDTSFLNSGQGADGAVLSLALQPDGKILIGGLFGSVNGVARVNLARLNADGSLDASFQGVTFDFVGGPAASVEEVVLQPDGKVLVGGFFNTVNGAPRGNLARFNPDGSLDASFVVPGSNHNVFAVALQPDGKILVGGDFTTFHDVPRGGLARLNPDGSLDASFPAGSGVDGFVNAIRVRPDGKVIVTGFFTNFNGVARTHLARVNADGTLDTSFPSSGSGANATVSALALQPDGKILIGGFFTSVNGAPKETLARLDAAGGVDAAFGASTPLTVSDVRAVALQPDGKIVVAGLFRSASGQVRNNLARYNPDGSLDPHFPAGDLLLGAAVEALALQPDGKILVGGLFTFSGGSGSRRHIIRLNADGSLDTSFLPTGGSSAGPNSDVYALAVQPDGKVLLGGRFSSFSAPMMGTVPRFKVLRLLPTGALDVSFNGPSALAGGFSVYEMALQADGKVIIADNILSLSNDPQRAGLARLNADGSHDPSFAGGVPAGQNIYALALQPDGKILIGGVFTHVNGTPRNRLARLNADGTLDASFLATGSGVNGTVRDIALQPDGKILIGGNFTSVHGVGRGNFARLKADGSLDETFSNFGPGANRQVRAVAVQPDGKVVLGGEFSSVNGATRFGIARLTADTSGPNPIDTPANFVRQHYRDFLNREPDPPGLGFWSNEIDDCGADAQCREAKRINVSAAFFLSIEFQETGYLVYRAHKTAFGNLDGKPVPVTRAVMLRDMQVIGNGVVVGTEGWEQKLEQNKQAYFEQVAASQPFLDRHPLSLTPRQFVDALNANADGALSQAERDVLVNDLGGNAKTRAQVLRAVAEDADLSAGEFNKAFVLMQYYGYLRRNPDDVGFDGRPDPNFDGFNFWLSKLNSFNGNFVQAEMVKAFIESIEYRQRFGQ